MDVVIPRLLHHIWLGPRPLPDEWLNAWAAMHPGWEQRVWRETDLSDIQMANRSKYRDMLKRGCWHGASDIARISILREHGGVYVDLDSKPLRSLDGAPFMQGTFFAGYEPVASLPGRIANGTIGATPDHDILRTYDRLIRDMTDLSEPWDTVGGTGLTAAVLVHRRCCKPTILPSRAFYPTDAHGRPVAGPDSPYMSHLWATTNRLYEPRAVVMVPRRAGDPRRDRTWEFVRQHWEADGWHVVEGHHDEGPFNAAAARNAAARNADSHNGCKSCAQPWEVAVFVDADTIMLDHRPVREAVRLAHKTGKFVRPYDRYWMTDEQEADALMADGTRPAHARLLTAQAHGGVNVVPRALYEDVGGYDEGFRGWGSEDTAFELACRAMGGFARVKGEVFHLWHPISDDRNTSHPGFIANVARRRLYERATKRGDMRWLLDHRDDAPAIAAPRALLLVLTNGRREWLPRTMASIDKHVRHIGRKLIVDDSGDREYADWLRETFPGVRVIAHRHLGHGPAVHSALLAAAQGSHEWVFVCEDDMEFTADIDLTEMATVMNAEPGLVQMVIKRQAWFPLEKEHGATLIDRFDPAAFTERTDGTRDWLEHRLFYSMNPHLVRRSFLATHPWPPRPNSEHHFGLRLFRDKSVRCGIWGRRDDPPRVMHIGLERTGTGY